MPLPSSDLCTVTAHFVNADGTDKVGVVARFTPTRASERLRGTSFVGSDTTVQSDEDGLLEMVLIRGMSGILSVTGLPLFREVRVPDASSCNLFDLIADAPDPLEPTSIEVTTLPRRS